MKSNRIKSNKVKELVINWHLTEACNYKCNYCFAKWGKSNELHRSFEAIEKLINNLSDFFIKKDSPLKVKLKYDDVRINFAGGEPMMLGRTLSFVLKLAKQKGFKTSIITNGHYLLNKIVELPHNTLDMVGISFDSQNYETRQLIGRVDRKGSSVSADDLKFALTKLSQTQKNIKTKINTVVNIHNWQEDFSGLISELKIFKWKVLQVMPYGSNDLLISNEQFNSFVERHSNRKLPIYSESNLAMTESYLMIDPKGRFYQNTPDSSGYQYSECINDVGAEIALNQINFNEAVFIARYFPVESILCEV